MPLSASLLARSSSRMAGAAAPARLAPDLPPPSFEGEDELSLLSRVGQGALSGLSWIGNALDLPSSMLRDTMTLNNPFDQLLTPFSDVNRVSGRDLLTQYGLAQKNKETGIGGWWDDPMEAVRDIGGFAVESALDAPGFGILKHAGKFTKGTKAYGRTTQAIKDLPGVQSALATGAESVVARRAAETAKRVSEAASATASKAAGVADKVPGAAMAGRAAMAAGGGVLGALALPERAAQAAIDAGVRAVKGAGSAPHRSRFAAEAVKAYGDKSEAVLNVMDARFARQAQETGGNADDFYKELTARQSDEADVGASALRQDVQPQWYSNLSRVVDEKIPERVTQDQLMGTLNGRVKKEEMEWAELDELFEAKGNQKYTDPSQPGDFGVGKVFGDAFGEKVGARTVTKQEVKDWIDTHSVKLEETWRDGEFTEYGDYTLEGGSNYRELVVRLPHRRTRRDASDEATEFRQEKHAAYGDGWVNKATPEEIAQYNRLISEEDAVATAVNYHDPHWGMENPIVHLRMKDRTGPNGEKVLHVEELQSDWHQAGSKQGYTKSGEPYNPDGDVVPDAPFKKSWVELGVKRAMRVAAEEGYDKLAFSTGDAVDAIGMGGKRSGLVTHYDEVMPNTLNKLAKKYGQRMADPTPMEPPTPVAWYATKPTEWGFSTRTLETQEAAAEFVARQGGESSGWSYKAMYADGKTDTPNVVGSARTIDITPEMRADVMKGQPLFQGGQAGARGAVEFKDSQTIIHAFKNADISTLAHEVGHVFRRDLPDKLMKDAESSVADLLGGAVVTGKDGTWTREAEEAFARGFERYLKDGVAPSKGLQAVFDKFKVWLTDIYRSISGDGLEINDGLKQVFDTMLTPEAGAGLVRGVLGGALSGGIRATRGTKTFLAQKLDETGLGRRTDFVRDNAKKAYDDIGQHEFETRKFIQQSTQQLERAGLMTPEAMDDLRHAIETEAIGNPGMGLEGLSGVQREVAQNMINHDLSWLSRANKLGWKSGAMIDLNEEGLPLAQYLHRQMTEYIKGSSDKTRGDLFKGHVDVTRGVNEITQDAHLDELIEETNRAFEVAKAGDPDARQTVAEWVDKHALGDEELKTRVLNSLGSQTQAKQTALAAKELASLRMKQHIADKYGEKILSTYPLRDEKGARLFDQVITETDEATQSGVAGTKSHSLNQNQVEGLQNISESGTDPNGPFLWVKKHVGEKAEPRQMRDADGNLHVGDAAQPSTTVKLTPRLGDRHLHLAEWVYTNHKFRHEKVFGNDALSDFASRRNAANKTLDVLESMQRSLAEPGVMGKAATEMDKSRGLADLDSPTLHDVLERAGASRHIDDAEGLSTLVKGENNVKLDMYAAARSIREFELEKAFATGSGLTNRQAFENLQNYIPTLDGMTNKFGVDRANPVWQEPFDSRMLQKGLTPKAAAEAATESTQWTKKDIDEYLSRPVDQEIADEVIGLMDYVMQPVQIGTGRKAVASFNNLFKAGVLNWPARFSRDITGGLFNNAARNLWHPIKEWTAPDQARKLWFGMDDKLPDMAGQVRDNPQLQAWAKEAGLDTSKDEDVVEAVRQMFVAHNGENVAMHRDVAGLSSTERIATEGDPRHLLEGVPGRPGTPTGFVNLLREAGAKTFGRREGSDTILNPKNWLNIRGVMDKTGELRRETTLGAVQAGEMIGNFTDGMNRLVPFISALRRGDDVVAAMEKITRAQVNYSGRSFTPTERDLKLMFPFYSFARKMVPEVAAQVAKDPGSRLGRLGGIVPNYADAFRMARLAEDERPMPERIRQTGPIPIGTLPDGTKSYLTGLGLMHEELGSFAGGPADIGRELISRMTPLIKGPLEAITGESFFQRGPMGGRDLVDMDPTMARTVTNVYDKVTGNKTIRPDQTLGAWARSPTWRTLEQVAANSPLSRALTTARTLTDPRKSSTWIPGAPGLRAILPTLTGLRFADVSPSQQDSFLQETLDALVREQGGRTFTKSYFQRDLLNGDPQMQEQAAVKKEIEGILQRKRKARGAAAAAAK